MLQSAGLSASLALTRMLPPQAAEALGLLTRLLLERSTALRQVRPASDSETAQHWQ